MEGALKLDHPEAEQFARIIWQATMAAWDLCLGGHDWPAKKEMRERMKFPRPGDMVVEASAGLRKLDCAMAVGWLVREAREPIEVDEWNVEEDGPIPLEKVVYITAIDGRDARWVDCEFFQVPTYPGWWDSERWQKALAEKRRDSGSDPKGENAEGG
jgi:hypothetical protein